jgi:hypothetical protein
MAQAAETGVGGGAPFAKFTQIGATFIGAFGGGKQRQKRDYKTGDPLWKDAEKTKPRKEEVMWFVAMPGTTALVGKEEDLRPIEEGATIRFSVDGFKWGQVIDGRKALPAYSGFAAGTSCSGDVYTFTLVGYSSETENAAAAAKAGFTVSEGRIIMRTPEEHETWVLHRVRNNQNTNAAKDYTVEIRRPTADEKRWEQAADALFSSAPWDKVEELVTAGGGRPDNDLGDEEPF